MGAVRALRVLPAVMAFVLPLFFATAGRAQELHELFEERCGRCHGHAGTFARENLAVTGGQLLGRRSGRAVSRFLQGHYGRLSDGEIADLVALFRFQIASAGLYREMCLICHDSARDLAKNRLLVRNDRLVGRYSGRDMAEFLLQHGRLSESQAEFMLQVLRWQREDGPVPESPATD